MSAPADGKPQVGAPGDLFSAFAHEATRWASAPAPDPTTAACVTLGWRLGEALTWTKAGTEKEIDRLGDQDAQLPPAARWAVLVGQIEAASPQLGGTDAKADATADPAASLEDDPPPATTEAAVAKLRDRMLRQLYVTDESRGKAFRLGYELQQLCADPSDASSGDLRTRASSIQVLLVALATKLPANAAHSVRNSLILWEDQFAKIGSEPRLLDTLYQQGDIWRNILSGEVAAKDLLRVSDYVGTAEEVVGRLRELARRALTGHLLLLGIGVLVLLAVGVALLAIFNDNPGGVTAGAGSLVAAFGLTWKGIGNFFGHAASRAEQALWNAQIDWTIAYRATLSASQPAGPPEQRRAHRDDHVRTWTAWKQKWPDLDVVDDRPPTTGA